MNRRILGSMSVVVGLVLATACHLPSDRDVHSNTRAIKQSTAALKASNDRLQENAENLKQSAEPLRESNQAITSNSNLLRESQDLIRDNTAAIERSRVAIEANTAEVGEIAAGFKDAQRELKELHPEDLILELRLALIVAFLAFAFVVTTVGNDARTSCEDLLLDSAKETPPKSDADIAIRDIAIRGRADDFVNTYRWALRLLALAAAYLLLRVIRGHCDVWRWTYFLGVLLSACLLAAFYRRESGDLEQASAKTLSLPRDLWELLGTRRRARIERP